MKLKRILSSALVVIMLFSAVAVLIPFESEAAHYSSVSETRLSDEDVKKIVEDYRKGVDKNGNTFASLQKMFEYELGEGYLDRATNAMYSIYVNRYTGVMYYRDELTGQMLSSNAYNFAGKEQKSASPWASQVAVSFSSISDPSTPTIYYSSEWAAQRNQIQVSKIENGLRVSYAIGVTSGRCLIPVWIEAHEFENDILRPIMDAFYNKMVENLGEAYALDFFGGYRKVMGGWGNNKRIEESDELYYNEEAVYSNRYFHEDAFRLFWADLAEVVIPIYESKNGMDTQEVKEIENLALEIQILYGAYYPFHPDYFNEANDLVPEKVVNEDMMMYVIQNPKYDQIADKAKTIKKYCKDYTFELMYEDENECGYEHKYESNPIFRCSLEYTFNKDNSLSVRLPSNSIVFDETEYILNSITPLQYFGAASFKNDGYMFVPDGSGSIIEFEDFRGSNVSMSAGVSFYGTDYCYSKITGAHKQALTMPVYGVVSEKDASGNDLNFGYFAILEEGSSMATINTLYETTSYGAGTVYTSFAPYPADKFDLSSSLTVSDNASYTKVSESKYTGSYVTRYVMLTGDDASYVGMAAYYRNYLEDMGVLTALTSVSDDLPLYLEALGSLEVVEKVLTFPVNVSKPITTFEDVVAIYDDLGRAKERMLEKAAEYDALAAEALEDNPKLSASYTEIANEYRRIVAEELVVNIDNVNFKLTGFTNGGLDSTYPTRVRWERSLGGKRGFKNLLEVAASKTGDGSNFGVYPDFDFQYISRTSLFDGVGKRNTVSRMVDNRYASKQLYSNITGEYKTNYSMIVSADALDRLYSKFVKRYSKYDATGISVSTLGSDLNSNFDEKNPISRDDAQGYVTSLLDRIANESNYSVMISQGNIYAVKYADHILNVCTDSSYYRYSSYSIPFTGMILHGYVNYAGAPLNYSGSPDYDLLRSIENGAALYYIIGYQNTDVMKDDEVFNKYYSVSYDHWFDDIVKNYAKVNKNLKDLQNYKIVDHEVLIGERVIDQIEQRDNLKALMKEFIEQLDAALYAKVTDTYDYLQANANGTKYGLKIEYTDAHVELLVNMARERFELDSDEVLPDSEQFVKDIKAVLDSYKSEYEPKGDTSDMTLVDIIDPIDAENNWLKSIDYTSKYQYVTDSTARDENYNYTDYTVDNDLIVMVTYKHDDGRMTSFILNYNIYSVEVTLENGESYTIPKYDFVRIDH